MSANLPARKPANTGLILPGLILQRTLRGLAEFFLMLVIFVMTCAAIIVAAIASATSYLVIIVTGRRHAHKATGKRGWKIS